MQFTKDREPSIWRQCVQEALAELDQAAFRNKLEIARMAIEMRRMELDLSASSDCKELEELSANLHTIYALGFLKDRSEES